MVAQADFIAPSTQKVPPYVIQVASNDNPAFVNDTVVSNDIEKQSEKDIEKDVKNEEKDKDLEADTIDKNERAKKYLHDVKHDDENENSNENVEENHLKIETNKSNKDYHENGTIRFNNKSNSLEGSLYDEKNDGFVNPVFHVNDEVYQVREEDTKRNNSIRSNTSQHSRPDKHINLYKYGWLCIKGKVLETFNKPVWFVFFLCFAIFAQGFLVTGISFLSITSIEKQFGLTSTEVGLFGTSNDVAYGFCCFFIGYIGHKHKPRWIGLGLILIAIAAFVFTIPKYVYGEYVVGVVTNQDFCRLNTGNNTVLTKDCIETTHWYNKFFFFLASILMGIGAIPLATLGTAHLHEVCDPAKSGIYMALFYASAVVGPGLGFIIGLPILETWVDIEQPQGSNLSTEDRNWVGAWWLGYLMGAGLLLIPAIPMLGFPKTFASTEKMLEKRRKLPDVVVEDKNLRHDLNSLWPATKALFKNSTFIFICLGAACETLASAGFSTFISKFIETQFHYTASESSLFAGIIILPGAALGIIAGGILMSKKMWTCKQVLKISSIISLVAVVPVLSTLVGCGSRTIVGASVPYFGGDPDNIKLSDPCNANCDCTTRYYKPVCLSSKEKDLTFFSPCHAGCKAIYQSGETFFNCTCAQYFDGMAAKVEDGGCDVGCNYFPLFAVAMFLMIAITFVNNVPILHCVFRVVPEGQGSFAMGFQQVFVRFLGFIPAPTVFGSLIDTSCELWQYDDCTDEKLNCLEYDNADFRLNLFILGCVTKFFTFVFIYLAYKSYELPTKPDEAAGEPKDNPVIENTDEHNQTAISVVSNISEA